MSHLRSRNAQRALKLDSLKNGQTKVVCSRNAQRALKLVVERGDLLQMFGSRNAQRALKPLLRCCVFGAAKVLEMPKGL